REARFRDLGGALEVEEAERLADLFVGLRREGELSRLAPLADLRIVLAPGADRHRRVWQVRKLQGQARDLLIDRLHLTGEPAARLPRARSSRPCRQPRGR